MMGGPREVSMPWPLKEAGGRREGGLGERDSLPGAAVWGEKYERRSVAAAAAAAVADEVDCWARESGGLVARRGRVEMVAAVVVVAAPAGLELDGSGSGSGRRRRGEGEGGGKGERWGSRLWCWGWWARWW